MKYPYQETPVSKGERLLVIISLLAFVTSIVAAFATILFVG